MKRIITALLGFAVLVSCVENDLPYPLVVPSVTSIDVDAAVSVKSDSDQRTIDIVLEEKADPEHVRIKSVLFNEAMTEALPAIVAEHDLSAPKKFIFRTYQDYEWTVSATRPVERRFVVSSQVGTSTIDDVNRRAVAFVPSSVDLENIDIADIKLGPRDISTITPDPSTIHDFSNAVEVLLTWADKSEVWTLHVEPTELSVEMKTAEPWTRVAWLSASGISGRENGFRYRRKGDLGWINAEGVSHDGGDFSVCIEGLEPETSYECLAFSGSDESAIVEIVTEAESQLPNSGFESFSHCESSNFYSWFDPSSTVVEHRSKWWDSGSVASTTVGSSYAIAMPDSDCHEGKYSAKLVSRNVIIKFAAGNTFSGEFYQLVGTQGGIINFGRPFTLRPRAMRLWIKYDCGKIDCVASVPEGSDVKAGDPDRCQLWIALGDWDYRKFGGTRECPVQVNTTDKSTYFRPDSEAVIAYGSYISDKSTDGWTEIEIPLEYSSVTRRPSHVIVSFASSMLGDYFTGSSDSRLLVDDIRLVY